MAYTLRIRTIDNADGALEPRLAQARCRRVPFMQDNHEARHFRVMKCQLIATWKRRTDILAFGQRPPIRGGRNRPVMRRGADQHRIAAIALAHELADVELTAPAHVR